MIEANPTVNRRVASYYISEDLEKLYVAFIDVTDVKSHISYMQRTLKSSSKSDREILNNFWQEHSNELKHLALRDNTSRSKVMSSMKNAAADSIANKRSSSYRPTERKAKKRQPVQESVHENERENIVKECDGIYVCDNTDSIGTIIKRDAIKIHEKLLNNDKLTLRQRKIMTNGLSSILDLSDNSLASQRTLFSEKEWTEIQTLFNNKLEITPNKLTGTAKDVILIVSSTLGLSGDYECCIALVKREIERSRCGMTVVALNIFKQILKVMMKYPHMLTKPSSKKVTENDYFRCIWSPIFEAIFPPESGRIRIKSGESINSSSTNNKNEQYTQAKYIKSLKVDFRLLVDLSDGHEVDVAAGECALFDDDDKAITDEGKLTRESKDALDEIIKIAPNDLGNNTCWNIQTTGPHCILSTIHLEAQGLYINKHRHSFNIPSLNSCLEDVGASIEWLIAMRDQMLRLENLIKKHSIKKHCNDSTFNRKDKQIPNPKLAYIRDTYYTPPRNEQSKLPVFIYSVSPPEALSESSKYHQHKTDDPLDTADSAKEYEFITEADKYGYRTVRGGTFYNIYTKKFYGTHPFP